MHKHDSAETGDLEMKCRLCATAFTDFATFARHFKHQKLCSQQSVKPEVENERLEAPRLITARPGKNEAVLVPVHNFAKLQHPKGYICI